MTPQGTWYIVRSFLTPTLRFVHYEITPGPYPRVRALLNNTWPLPHVHALWNNTWVLPSVSWTMKLHRNSIIRFVHCEIINREHHFGVVHANTTVFYKQLVFVFLSTNYPRHSFHLFQFYIAVCDVKYIDLPTYLLMLKNLFDLVHLRATFVCHLFSHIFFLQILDCLI